MIGSNRMGVSKCLKCEAAFFDFELGEMICKLTTKLYCDCECGNCEPYCLKCCPLEAPGTPGDPGLSDGPGPRGRHKR